MFRHIYNTIKKLITRERKPAPPAPHAVAYSRGPTRHTRYHSDQLALDAAQARALNERDGSEEQHNEANARRIPR